MAPEIEAMTKNGNQDTISSWKRCDMERILIASLIWFAVAVVCGVQSDRMILCETNGREEKKIDEKTAATWSYGNPTSLETKSSSQVYKHTTAKATSVAVAEDSTKMLEMARHKRIYLDKSFRLTWINLRSAQNRHEQKNRQDAFKSITSQHTNRRSQLLSLALSLPL